MFRDLIPETVYISERDHSFSACSQIRNYISLCSGNRPKKLQGFHTLCLPRCVEKDQGGKNVPVVK